MLTVMEKMFYEWLSGRVDDIQYLSEAKNLPAPWLTKKWVAIREALIKSHCENCGSQDYLTLSHDWSPEKFRLTVARINAGLDPEYKEKFEAFVSGFYTPEGFRRPGLKTYRAEPTRTDLYVLECEFLEANYSGFTPGTPEAAAAIKEQFLLSLRYYSCADTRTLCRKCAFHVDKKRRKIK
jgi:hypothetical protein